MKKIDLLRAFDVGGQAGAHRPPRVLHLDLYFELQWLLYSSQFLTTI